jgi:Mrp family chromosome partitioning ATPase
MGIIEKAMGRAQPERDPGAASGSAGRKMLARLTEEHSLPFCDAPPVAVRANLALEQFPPLARDFRFLKRPVLARVFGLSRTTSRAGNLVMITSDLPQAGKSFISVNLGASMAAEQMTRVLLVDADPVRHTLSSRLGIDARPGLLELLAGEADHVGEVIMRTDMPSLFVLPAGQPRGDATELLAGPRMAEILATFSDPNLVVVLDSPPLLVSSEGRVLADHVHHALVVVEAGRSVTSDVATVLDLLKGTAASVSLVLNKTPIPSTSRYKDYYYPY